MHLFVPPASKSSAGTSRKTSGKLFRYGMQWFRNCSLSVCTTRSVTEIAKLTGVLVGQVKQPVKRVYETTIWSR